MRTTLFPVQLPLLRLTKQPDGLTEAVSKEPLDEMLHNAAGTSRDASVFSAQGSRWKYICWCQWKLAYNITDYHKLRFCVMVAMSVDEKS